MSVVGNRLIQFDILEYAASRLSTLYVQREVLFALSLWLDLMSSISQTSRSMKEDLVTMNGVNAYASLLAHRCS